MAGIKFTNKEYSYTMLESAKLMCQYKDLLEDSLGFNEAFQLWYSAQSQEDLDLIAKDQESRKLKQIAKNTGKALGFLGGLMLGFASISKSPTKDIAKQASYDEEIWMYLYLNNINYKTLRKFL